MRLKTRVGAFFVGTHQARVARHIGGEDRGETAGGGHHSSGIPALRSPANKVASNKVVFGESVPHSPPAFIFAMLDNEPSPRSLRASASSLAARSNSPLRA